MTATIIITLCSLLLLAYLFDVSSARTKIPSVILLLLLGWLVREAAQLAKINIPPLTGLLPILGTIGLVLIVLDGSLELELNWSKKTLIKKSFLVSLIPLVVMALALGYAFSYYSGANFKDGVTNALPFCVISSAIAIPSAKNLVKSNREFVIYESSFSDIVGVLLFNFIALNNYFEIVSIGMFLLQIILIIIISFFATVGLSFLLKKIEHPIKFAPIILLVILIYETSKIYNLPSLIFILLFGLFLGNLDEMKRFSWINRLKPEELNKEVNKFKELIVEATFLIRALFFLLFGYLMKTSEILDTSTLVWSASIVAGIFIVRAVQLKISKLPLMPLLFIAPRGLITILLFLSVSEVQAIPFVNRSMIVQVILLTALVMMYGLIAHRKTNDQPGKEVLLDKTSAI